MNVMPFEPGSNLQAGTAETLFNVWRYRFSFGTRLWDVSPDGRRLLMITGSGAATTDDELEIVLIQNWFQGESSRKCSA